jgi:hypothetical protein
LPLHPCHRDRTCAYNSYMGSWEVCTQQSVHMGRGGRLYECTKCSNHQYLNHYVLIFYSLSREYAYRDAMDLLCIYRASIRVYLVYNRENTSIHHSNHTVTVSLARTKTIEVKPFTVRSKGYGLLYLMTLSMVSSFCSSCYRFTVLDTIGIWTVTMHVSMSDYDP